MKSSKPTPLKIRFVYEMISPIIEDDTIEDFCEYWKNQRLYQFEQWIDDDGHGGLDPIFMVTTLYLNMFQQATYIELTERGL